MSNRGRDISRGRRLTAEEAAEAAKVREQVMEEIPPATSNVIREKIDKLRQLREQHGLSLGDKENTMTISLPPATLEKIRAQADATGKDVETVVCEAVELGLSRRKRSLAEILEPINEAIQASGMSEEQVTAVFERELQAHRAERRSTSTLS